MRIKEKLAKMLVKLARRLAPNRYDRVETLTGYEPMKLGLSLAVSEAEISHYRQAEKCSYRKAKVEAIKDMKKRIRQSIYGSLIEGGHIEYNCHSHDDETIVSGYIRIYKRKE